MFHLKVYILINNVQETHKILIELRCYAFMLCIVTVEWRKRQEMFCLENFLNVFLVKCKQFFLFEAGTFVAGQLTHHPNSD